MFLKLPFRKYISGFLKSMLPLVVLSFLAYATVNFVLKSFSNKVNNSNQVIINNVETNNTKPKRYSFGYENVLGISDYGGAGYIDIMGPADNLFTPLPMPTVPANSVFRHPTYQNRTPVYNPAWGNSMGCDIDKVECVGWTWKFVCDVAPNITWMTQKNPDWTSEEEAQLYNRHCTYYSNGNGITNPVVSRPTSASQVYNVNDVSCGKLVQIDVTKENCMPDGPTCPYDSPTLDYIIYYTGDCSRPLVTPTPTPTPTVEVTPTPTPTPTPTVQPSVACKSLTGVARGVDNATVYPLSSLPENFEGTLTLTCIGESVVKPIVTMEFVLTKNLSGSTTDTSIRVTGEDITEVIDPICTTGSLCFKGEAIFNISGQGSYSAKSKVCNIDNLCSP